MTIDIHGERLLTLSQVVRALPKKVAPSTIWRWYRKGIRGVVLETVLVGGTRYTSVEALNRFATTLTDNAQPDVLPAKCSDDVEPRSAETESQLRAAGLI